MRVSFDVTLPQTIGSRTVAIKFPRVSFTPSDLTNSAQASYWFVRNNWHRQTYYAVGSKFHPTATRFLANPCPTTPPDCISVVTGPPKARAVLVLAGRHLGTGTRTYTIANYFEDENQASTPATTPDTPDYIFEKKQRSKHVQRPSRRRGGRAMMPHATPARVGARGFTLTELAIVMMIVALLAGGLLMTLAAQNDTRELVETRRTLDTARDALIGFAIANGRLPCPATAASGGREAPIGGGACTITLNGSAGELGFLPAITLGIGPTNNVGQLLDAWGNPVRYAVTRVSSNAYTTAGALKAAGYTGAAPDSRPLRLRRPAGRGRRNLRRQPHADDGRGGRVLAREEPRRVGAAGGRRGGEHEPHAGVRDARAGRGLRRYPRHDLPERAFRSPHRRRSPLNRCLRHRSGVRPRSAPPERQVLRSRRRFVDDRPPSHRTIVCIGGRTGAC